jgi:hypothetical protein
MNKGRLIGVALLGVSLYLFLSADKNKYGTDIKSETTTAATNNEYNKLKPLKAEKADSVLRNAENRDPVNQMVHWINE